MPTWAYLYANIDPFGPVRKGVTTAHAHPAMQGAHRPRTVHIRVPYGPGTQL